MVLEKWSSARARMITQNHPMQWSGGSGQCENGPQESCSQMPRSPPPENYFRVLIRMLISVMESHQKEREIVKIDLKEGCEKS